MQYPFSIPFRMDNDPHLPAANYVLRRTVCSIQVQFGGLSSEWDHGAKAPEQGV